MKYVVVYLYTRGDGSERSREVVITATGWVAAIEAATLRSGDKEHVVRISRVGYH